MVAGPRGLAHRTSTPRPRVRDSGAAGHGLRRIADLVDEAGRDRADVLCFAGSP
jgi:hypothetical protein